MNSSNALDRSFLSGETNGGVWDGASAPTGEDSWKSSELGGGIYMLGVDGGNPGGNLGLLVGDEGAVLIDNGLEKAASMTLATVERMANGPVDYVINTHLHGDHVSCNPHFARTGAAIVAHENTRRALVADDQFDRAGLPTITFNDEAAIHMNGHQLKLLYIPNAHTDSDAVVHFTDANVIHAGDLFFNKVFPFVDLNNGGDIDGFIAAQRRVIELADENTKIIPGHGPLGDRADMQSAVDMLVAVKSCVKSLVDRGMSMEDVLKENPLAAFDDWSWFHIPTERMTKIMYCLLKGE